MRARVLRRFDSPQLVSNQRASAQLHLRVSTDAALQCRANLVLDNLPSLSRLHRGRFAQSRQRVEDELACTRASTVEWTALSDMRQSQAAPFSSTAETPNLAMALRSTLHRLLEDCMLIVKVYINGEETLEVQVIDPDWSRGGHTTLW